MALTQKVSRLSASSPLSSLVQSSSGSTSLAFWDHRHTAVVGIFKGESLRQLLAAITICDLIAIRSGANISKHWVAMLIDDATLKKNLEVLFKGLKVFDMLCLVLNLLSRLDGCLSGVIYSPLKLGNFLFQFLLLFGFYLSHILFRSQFMSSL
jgi:hypothetical protein